MLDEVKKQKIIQLVKSSNILTAQEKTDWLSLLELMNDKQITELEEILKPKTVEPVATPVQKTSVVPKPVAQMPPKDNLVATKPTKVQDLQQPQLSHISNLPNQISEQRVPILPTKRPVSVVPNPKPEIPRNIPTSPKVSPQTPNLEAPSKLQATKPPVKVAAIAEPLIRDKQPLSLSALEDVGGISASALHHETREQFYKIIIGFAGQFGYFQTLEYFRTSPLYRDYLNYGKTKLSGDSDVKLALSHEEFEFITDLLLALKVNRV